MYQGIAFSKNFLEGSVVKLGQVNSEENMFVLLVTLLILNYNCLLEQFLQGK